MDLSQPTDNFAGNAHVGAALPSAKSISASGPVLHTALQALSPAFYSALPADPVPDPHWIATSQSAATDLGIGAQWLQSDAALQLLSGNAAPATAQTRATVYSGHQFGVWAGQLGDGRALLLGEFDSLTGPMELQLKGSGATPYSRGGDGRAVLRSSIREFLVSEAMHALGIPTTRALSVIGSPLRVRRETSETAAVVARTAPSFLRFGHFEHFAAAGRVDELRALADYVINHHYPECRDGTASPNPYAALLQTVSERTASLVAHWQSVGFCHGVLNTDNMSILGLTIDYGPFQFLDAYVPNHVCNHSDQLGRYAFDRQPNVAYWNLYCLGQALQPLIGEPEEVVQALESYKRVFPAQLVERFGAKLGLTSPVSGDAAMIDGVLQLLANDAVDFTRFWRALTLCVAGQVASTDSNQDAGALTGHSESLSYFEPVRDMFINRAALDAWLLSYTERLTQLDKALSVHLMEKSNPQFVLRNYLAEHAIRIAQTGDFTEIHRLQSVLASPFDDHAGCENYAALPPDWASQLSISCSS